MRSVVRMQAYHGGMTSDQSGTRDYDYVPEYLSLQEAAEVLRTNVTVVNRLIVTGALPRYRLRERYVRVRTEDVMQLHDVPVEWLARC